MIEIIELHNFKSARNLKVKISNLTMLAGLNGSGKSSVLQAIALLKQSLREGDAAQNLLLRGQLVRLGKSEDVRFENAEDDRLVFRVKTPNGTVQISAPTMTGADTLPIDLMGDVQDLIEQLNVGFQFIQADRITPAPQYSQASTQERSLGWLGCRGEYTADFLQQRGNLKISERRHYSKVSNGIAADLLQSVAPTDGLLDQVAGWLQHLSPGIRPSVSPLDVADAAALHYTYTGTTIDSQSREHRASNVGFGLTYCLPIVVACLAAPAGALLLLENPEAHLHPRGQAALGQLLAFCAADGVQIVVETHSDHVLNGIRIAVKNDEHVSCDDISLHYFERNINTGETSISSPRLGPDGQLDSWPEGFFDQWDKDLDALLS